jgi:hypothetical protein
MVAPTCFGITLPSSGSVPSAFWEMLNWGAFDRILWMGVLCLVTWCAVLSAVSVFVAVQPSSEIPEVLMNYPVYLQYILSLVILKTAESCVEIIARRSVEAWLGLTKIWKYNYTKERSNNMQVYNFWNEIFGRHIASVHFTMLQMFSFKQKGN